MVCGFAPNVAMNQPLPFQYTGNSAGGGVGGNGNGTSLLLQEGFYQLSFSAAAGPSTSTQQPPPFAGYIEVDIKLNGSLVTTFYSNSIPGGLDLGNVPFNGVIGGTVLFHVGAPNQTLQLIATRFGFGAVVTHLAFYSPCEVDLIKLQ
jgi:hypothetical protein